MIVGMILITLAIIAVVIVMALHGSHHSPAPPTPPTPPSPTPPSPIGGATLFIYPEVGGFTVEDFGGFPDPDVVKANFNAIAVIANASLPSFADMWNDSKVQALVSDSGVPLQRWLSFSFDSSTPYCSCRTSTVAGACAKNADTCKYPKDALDSCDDVVKDMIGIIGKNKPIVGIVVDTEVGDPTCIVAAFEKVAQAFPGLQLGWSTSLGAASMSSPKNEGKTTWDVCLGQAYTDTGTLSLYSGSCKLSSSFWSVLAELVKDAPASRAAPMVCGAGNCQDLNGCIDERMTGAQITQLLISRPATFKWRNFGIWYGTYRNPSFGNCANSDVSCTKKCCDAWKVKKPVPTPTVEHYNLPYTRHIPVLITDMERTQYERFPLFTQEGYMLGKLPSHLRKRLTDHWMSERKYRKKELIDDHTAKYIVAKKNKHPAFMVAMNSKLQRDLEAFILDELIKWTSLNNLVHTATYGIREYTDGAILSPHVDRPETHVLSAIIHVGSIGMREPWALEVYNRELPVRNIEFNQSYDFVLYESSSLVHGRPLPLHGDIYANLFIHYAPDDWVNKLSGLNVV